MPAETSPILALPFIQPSQAQKHVTHNEALRALDVLVQTVVEDLDRTDPPASPVTGQSHIVASPSAAAWAGHDGEIATFDGTAWLFTLPRPGWSAQVLAEGGRAVFDGATWSLGTTVSSGNPGTLGINTSADLTNRLAVSAPATLLTHEGSGHQVKVNKSGASDTASLLFQSGWSGRAEMGISGSDDFSVKVSADGAAWNTAMVADAGSGVATFPSGVALNGPVTGLAVQQSADDTTSGRLMRADYGYGPGNLLGTVAMNGPLPSGAVIERGSTADGEYVRFADGTQVCIQTLTLTQQSGARLTATWTYPAAFASGADLYLSGMINVSSFNANVTGPDLEMVLDVRFGTITATSVLAQMFRIAGQTNFAGADTCECRLFAFGRWN